MIGTEKFLKWLLTKAFYINHQLIWYYEGCGIYSHMVSNTSHSLSHPPQVVLSYE